MSHLAEDVRFAFRTLRKARTLTCVSFLTLVVAVGLNTAIFSVVESLLLRQMPYPAADRLVTIGRADAPARAVNGVDGWTIDQWRSRSRYLDSVSSFADAQAIFLDHGSAEVWRGMRVSSEFFDTLGIRLSLGRAFLPEDVGPSSAPVVILTHDLWTHRFAADPQIVGRVLDLNAHPRRVVGILPVDFRALRMTNPAEIPQYYESAPYDPTGAAGCHTCFGGRVIARLQPFSLVEGAEAELSGITRDIARESPPDSLRGTSVRVEPLLEHLIGPVRRAIWILFGAATLVLLVACANVAGLQLARATARQKEFALRAALGGSRQRLIAQLLTENLLLAAAGGTAGAFVSPWATSLLASWAPRELPRLNEIGVDARVFAVALTTTVLTGLLSGIVPALAASRVDINAVTEADRRRGGKSGGWAPAQRPRRRWPCVGVRPDPRHRPSDEKRSQSAERRGRIRSSPRADAHAGCGYQWQVRIGRRAYGVLPRVGRACAGGAWRRGGRHGEQRPTEPVGAVAAADRRAAEGGRPRQPQRRRCSGLTRYFSALRIPLRRGRWLVAHDGDLDGPPAAMISESLARSRFGEGDPIGRRIQLGSREDPGPWLTLVGVVADVRYEGLDCPPGEAVYQPQGINPFHYTRLIVRTNRDPWRVEPQVRATIRALYPAQPFFHVQLMDDYIASSLAERRFALSLFALFGVLTLLLGAVGVYGLVSFSVAERAPEIGLRAALGASRRSLFALIVTQGLTLACLGVGSGLVIAFVATRLMASLVFGVALTDPATVAVTAGILTLTAALACFVPACAAIRIDPLAALRDD